MNELTKGYLDFFEPDAFVETEAGQIDQARLSPTGRWQDRHRFRNFEGLIRSEPGRPPFLDLGLSMHRFYDHVYKVEFQFSRRSNARSFVFEGGDKIGRAFFEACYGWFPEDGRLDYIEKYYRGAIQPEVVEPSLEVWHLIETAQRAECPLGFTIRDIELRSHDGWGETIFIFDPLNGPDVVDFWNARIFKPNIVPVNSHWLESSRDVISAMIQSNHRPLPSNTNGVMIGTTIMIGRSLDAKKIRERLGLVSEFSPQAVSFQDWYPSIWRRPIDVSSIDSSPATLIAKRVEAQAEPSGKDQPSIRIPQLAPDFARGIRGRGPGWVNVVKVRDYISKDRFALAMPSAAIETSAHYPPRSFQYQIPTREGQVSFHNFPHDSNLFTLTTHQQAVVAWLKSLGIDASPSDAGRVTNQLIASVGGLDQTVLLAHPEAIQKFDDMARSRSIRADGNSEEHPDRTASVTQLGAVIRKLQKKLWGSHLTLDSFVGAGVLRLGLAVACTHCTKENWFSLNDVAETVRCARCLKDYPFPQGGLPSRDAWKYRVVGPFATSGYAQGGYAVALTLRFLAREFETLPALTWMTSLNLEAGAEKLETDFFLWHGSSPLDRNGREPTLLVGECKSFGSELFKAKDIERMKALAERLPGAILVAAALKNDFSPDEVKRLRSLCKWAWRRSSSDTPPTRVIILTGYELFSIGPFIDRWIEAEGHLKSVAENHPHIYSFDELALATQEAHLGFSFEEVMAMRYRHRKSRRPRVKDALAP